MRWQSYFLQEFFFFRYLSEHHLKSELLSKILTFTIYNQPNRQIIVESKLLDFPWIVYTKVIDEYGKVVSEMVIKSSRILLYYKQLLQQTWIKEIVCEIIFPLMCEIKYRMSEMSRYMIYYLCTIVIVELCLLVITISRYIYNYN